MAVAVGDIDDAGDADNGGTAAAVAVAAALPCWLLLDSLVKGGASSKVMWTDTELKIKNKKLQ